MSTKQLLLTATWIVSLVLAFICVWGASLSGAAIAAVVLLAGLLTFEWVKAVVS